MIANIYQCRSLISAKCESNELTPPSSYMCLFVGGCTVKQAIYIYTVVKKAGPMLNLQTATQNINISNFGLQNRRRVFSLQASNW